MDSYKSSLLESQLDYVIRHSDFYKTKWNNLFHTGCTLPDLEDFPFTEKIELLLNQEKYPPFGNYLGVSQDSIIRIHKTSGTSNKPLLIALTKEDITLTTKIGAACFTLSGLSDNDTVIHCLNYNMWAGGYTDHQSLENSGAAVIPFGVGNTKQLIETILTIKPTAIHCTPSYLRKIEAVLKEEFQRTPSSLGLKLGLFGGEAGIQNQNFRSMIEQNWGIKAMNANYGLSDVLSMFGAECKYQNGLHFMGLDSLLPELIDVKTKRNIEIVDGAIGELVLTHLRKEAQPLVRYRTNDIIKILSADTCPCGEASFRFEVIGRSDDMIVIKGVNVFVSAISNVINHHLDFLTGQYQIHINKAEPVDRMIIIIEKKRNEAISVQNISAVLFSEFREKLFISPEILVKDEGHIPHNEGKTNRVFKLL